LSKKTANEKEKHFPQQNQFPKGGNWEEKFNFFPVGRGVWAIWKKKEKRVHHTE